MVNAGISDGVLAYGIWGVLSGEAGNSMDIGMFRAGVPPSMPREGSSGQARQDLAFGSAKPPRHQTLPSVVKGRAAI